jgi:hypothetical protein
MLIVFGKIELEKRIEKLVVKSKYGSTGYC